MMRNWVYSLRLPRAVSFLDVCGDRVGAGQLLPDQTREREISAKETEIGHHEIEQFDRLPMGTEVQQISLITHGGVSPISLSLSGVVHPAVSLEPAERADDALLDGELGFPAGGLDFFCIQENEGVVADPAAIAAGVFKFR